MPEWDAPGWHWTRDELIALIDERIRSWFLAVFKEEDAE